MARILAFAGSLRRDSFNKKLVRAAAVGAGEAGASVTVLDLADYPMPVYDGDLEAEKGVPDNAQKLKEIFARHDGLLIASPEYNGSLSAALKNTIDWISRPTKEGENSLTHFRGKTAALLAASPGGLGGLRALNHLRDVLTGLRVVVIPSQLAVSRAHEVFTDDGVADDKWRERIEAVGKDLAAFTSRMM